MQPGIFTFLRDLSRDLVDFVYPPLCLCCDQLLEGGEKRVCRRCWSSITPATRELTLFLETRSRLLASGSIDELVSLFVFEKEGPFQKIVHALKYSGMQQVGRDLGERMGAAAVHLGIDANMIVPVPLHRRKLRERGYNQAALIAGGLSEMTGISVYTDIIRRTKWTETQTTLSRDERAENVKGAFSVDARSTVADSVIVVDDVITTGATTEAVGSALKAHGAKRIIAMSAAIAE